MPFLGTTGGGSVKQFGGLANLGYFIKNSLRFRRSATAYLNRTPTTAGNRRTYTWSGWLKLGTLGVAQEIFGAGSGSNQDLFNFNADYQFVVFTANASQTILRTAQLFRDPSAWYHIVVAVDTTQATSSNRTKIYVNGVQVTTFEYTQYPSQNYQGSISDTGAHYISTYDGSNWAFDGYMAEVNFIDGLQLTPSSFGKTDAATGQWIPKKYIETYGTNGFYLKFADASAATAAAIGKDSSPNGNNWTPNNISVTAGVTYDAMIDSPSLSGAASNYATLNPLDKYTSLPAPTNGNLSQANGGAAWYNIRSTIGVASGKWYAEVTQSGSNLLAGVMSGSSARNFTSYTDASGLYAFFNNGGGTTGYKYANGTSGSSFTIADNDVIGLAYDYDAQTLAIYRNGNLQDTVTSIPKTETMFFCASFAQTTGSTVWNFGQRPFAQSVPSGYKSLNTFNLP